MTPQQQRIVKANALIEASYRLSVAEQRVILSVIAQLRRDETISSTARYSVTANALADLSGVSAQRAYRELADAAQRIYRREVRIVGGANGEMRSKADGKPRVLMTRWVQAVEYIPGEGRVEIQFADPILPYLSDLKTHFTQYELANVAGMQSAYGIRLYELLIQWRQAGERELELEWFRYILGAEEKYKQVKDLKKYVIERAVQDVNEFSDLSVRVGYRKTGRRVSHVQFQFAPKKEQGQPKAGQGKRSRITEADIKAAARPGERTEDVVRRLQEERDRKLRGQREAGKAEIRKLKEAMRGGRNSVR